LQDIADIRDCERRLLLLHIPPNRSSEDHVLASLFVVEEFLCTPEYGTLE
jgi:hypothetical protein